MKKYDLIVIGGGISGMSFAHYAAKSDLSTLVLEKAAKPGGSFDTYESGKARKFWIEMGAHTCYNSYRNLIEVMEDCGIISEISPRAKVPFRVLAQNQLKSFPSQINFFELLASIPKAFIKKKNGETVQSYYGSILGKKNFKKIFSALFSAVPSQKADDFPADALFKKRERRKDILKSYTMQRGLGSITHAIAREKAIEFRTDMPVESIVESKGSYLVSSKGESFECGHLAICAALPAVPELLKGIDGTLAEKVSKIQYRPVESLGIIIKKDATDIKLFAGLVPTDDHFFSAVSRDTVPDEDYRGFTFHFKPGALSKEQKVKRICEILHISENDIIGMMEANNVVPALRLGHYDIVNEIDGLLKGKQLYMSGNYFAGLSIEDCVSRSKTEVSRLLKEVKR
jgi:oxygen-dependent protoporphyrinogen oxidase